MCGGRVDEAELMWVWEWACVYGKWVSGSWVCEGILDEASVVWV